MARKTPAATIAGYPTTRRRAALDELHADPDNVNTHDARNLAAIVASLRTFGQVENLVVQAGTGRVIGGNGRLEAMQALGWARCDVVEIEIDDRAADALAIALNRTAKLSRFDDVALAAKLDALLALPVVPIEATGYDESEVRDLLRSVGDAAAEGEVVDDPEAEWSGMPEYVNEDKTAYQSIHVHFKDQGAVDAFARLIGQVVTAKTRSTWYPEVEVERYADKAYVAGGGDES